MTITTTRMGGRKIELYLPFKFGSKRITVVNLRPIRWDQALRWQEGGYRTATDLLFEMADQPQEIMREIRYPDVERVMMQFVDLLPNDIREQVAAGEIPQIQPIEPEPPVPDEPTQVDVAPSGEPEAGPSGEYAEGQAKPWPEYPWPPGTEPPPEKKIAELPKDKQPEGVGFEL